MPNDLLVPLLALRRRAYVESCVFIRENRAAVIFVVLAGLAIGSFLMMERSAGGLLNAKNSTYTAYVLLLVASLFFAIPNYTQRYWTELKQNAKGSSEREELEVEQGSESAEFSAFGILLLIFGFLYQVVLLRVAG